MTRKSRVDESGAAQASTGSPAPDAGEALHSPLPWSVWLKPNEHEPTAVLQSANGLLVLQTIGDNDGANADFVVQCVNERAALIEALRNLITATERADNPGDMGVSTDDDVMKAARAVLAKAEGK